MNWYRNFLTTICNPTTGMWYWTLVEFVGWLMMLVWLAAALPWAGMMLGLDWLAKFGPDLGRTQMFIYNGLLSFEGESIGYYFAVIFFGILLVKIAILLQILGNNYRRRYIYIPPRISGVPLGTWIQQ